MCEIFMEYRAYYCFSNDYFMHTEFDLHSLPRSMMCRAPGDVPQSLSLRFFVATGESMQEKYPQKVSFISGSRQNIPDRRRRCSLISSCDRARQASNETELMFN